MPNRFHRQQYFVAAGLFAVCLFLYVFAPESKAAVIAGFAGSCLGFVTGKFTNGFNRKSKDEEQDS